MPSNVIRNPCRWRESGCDLSSGVPHLQNVKIGCETMQQLDKKIRIEKKGLGSQMPHQVTYDIVATPIRPTSA
eukprot:scaffold6687_cov92-Skeletonema_dohrnii-CCMP3373.AAC.3